MKLQGQGLIRYKQILVESLKAFDKLCKENNVKYFAVGGTAIGAARHKGFIPWDDDIDVAMLREDYDRFIALKNDLRKSKYKIIDYHDGGYYLPSAKFIDTNTTVWEIAEQPYIMGAYIDIFPLDYAEVTDNKLSEKFKNYQSFFERLRISKSNLKFRKTIHFLLTLHLKTFKKRTIEQAKCMLYLRRNIDNLIKRADQITDTLRTIHSDVVLNYNTFYPLHRELLKVDWFAETKTMPFEDTVIEMPIGYDSYLRQLFGDYMQLPPVEKRIGHHCCYYYNLNEHMSKEEVLRVMKKSNK